MCVRTFMAVNVACKCPSLSLIFVLLSHTDPHGLDQAPHRVFRRAVKILSWNSVFFFVCFFLKISFGSICLLTMYILCCVLNVSLTVLSEEFWKHLSMVGFSCKFFDWSSVVLWLIGCFGWSVLVVCLFGKWLLLVLYLVFVLFHFPELSPDVFCCKLII